MRLAAAVLACTALVRLAAATDPKPAPVQLTVDVSETPELKEWAAKAKELVEKWHPIIADLLKSDGFTPPNQVKLVFKKDQDIIAFASGRTISISAKWLAKHPDDFGMVAHELTHVIQSYRRAGRDTGWLVEGIADYVRFYHYEPGKIKPPSPKRARAKAGYRVTAHFLHFVTDKYDKQIVPRLNAALRNGEYSEGFFKKLTKKSLEELEKEWKASLEPAGR
jgi:hypothetical protein